MTNVIEYGQIVVNFSGTVAPEKFIHRKQIPERSVATSGGLGRGMALPVLGWRSVPPNAETTDTPFVQFKPSEREFNIVLSRILQLQLEEDDLRPTGYAFQTALALVVEANRVLRGNFARASAAVDEDGSISLYWRKPARNIELNIPAQSQGKHYIYHREGTEHGVERNVTADALAHWIEWFMSV